MDMDSKNIYPKQICEFEEKDGLVTVLFVNPNPSFLDKYIFKKLAKKPKKIDLDEIGSFVWKLCEGNKSINEIVELTRDHFGEKVEPADKRVELFIKQMHGNKLINLFEKVSDDN